MKLKVGMYVRFKDGNIEKINQLNEQPNNFFWFTLNHNVILKEKIKDIKASHNIIDLIEVGDLVVGKDNHKFEVYAVGYDCVYINNLKEFITVNEIKSIVTKEQFNAMKYEVGLER